MVVAGGGAAGMMAAITAARAGASVVLLEPNEKVGRKLYITGKGRCNLTNNCGRDALMASIPRNGKFLYSAFDRFGPADVMAFFEELGVKLKTERGNRVFPVSNKSADIVDALFFELRHQGVEVRQDRAVGLEVQDGQLSAVRTETGKDFKDCKALILATGGASYPRTGSTGEGYALAREAGHTVIPIRGSLVPLESADPCCGRLQGLSMRNVELRVKDGRGNELFDEALVTVDEARLAELYEEVLVILSEEAPLVPFIWRVRNITCNKDLNIPYMDPYAFHYLHEWSWNS